MPIAPYKTDVLIIGAGLAGLVCALELLDQNFSGKILILDRGSPERLGGLAKEAFGGIFLVNSKYQRRMGIHDSVDQAFQDWCSFAEFEDVDKIPRQWAEKFVHECTDHVGDWLNTKGVGFFPVVHWVEKGFHQKGNSVPRFHMVWGTGFALVNSLVQRLKNHSRISQLEILHGHRVEEFLKTNGKFTGVKGCLETSGEEFFCEAENVVVASGGICGNLDLVKKNWYKPWGEAPKVLLNGSILEADGLVHEAAQKVGAKITHLDLQWLYAAGVNHPEPRFKNHGLSLVPCKSALWLDAKGRRIGPEPLVTGFDTRYLVERICDNENKYSWQVLNQKIAYKELAVSGSEHNTGIRDKNLFAFLKTVLRGNRKLVNDLIETCPDFVVANSLDELCEKMNALNGDHAVELGALKESVKSYDKLIDEGPAFDKDLQLRLIQKMRQYRGDKARTCAFQKIDDQSAYPLIAIREFILTRKSLGGIQTNLNCHVLSCDGTSFDSLYAIGEAAGFGGGGIHGKRSLEGTFLGGCVLTARQAARSILGKAL